MKKDKVYIIAEAGVNHNGDLRIAKKLIYEAKKSGADAIKFQNFITSELVTKKAKKAPYQIKNTKNNEQQYKMLKKLELKLNDYYILKKFCREKKIDFLTSVFDIKSLFFVEKKLKMKTIKIPSGEITNFFLLDKINLNKYSVILSTGMSNLNEIKNAINRIAKDKIYDLKKKNIYKFNKLKNIKKKLTVMHCVTDYPVQDKYANLNCINSLNNNLGLNIGYSDHTIGGLAPLIAVSKGARIIEKHFTLNKKMSGPDHLASLDPQEFKEMVNLIRRFEDLNGIDKKNLFKCEIQNKLIARKSIVAKKYIQKGEKFTIKNITAKRPGDGLCPSLIDKIINKKSKKNFYPDEKIK